MGDEAGEWADRNGAEDDGADVDEVIGHARLHMRWESVHVRREMGSEAQRHSSKARRMKGSGEMLRLRKEGK